MFDLFSTSIFYANNLSSISFDPVIPYLYTKKIIKVYFMWK